MFDEEQLNEFINRMFENASKYKNKSNVSEELRTFRKYLEDTRMCSEDYLQKLDKIVKCADELVSLKGKVPALDITTIFKEEEIITRKSQSPNQKTIGQFPSYKPSTNNHRSHYINASSNACGNSTPSSYSNSCGGGSTYRGC